MIEPEVKSRSRGGVTVTINNLYVFDCILVDGTAKVIDPRRYTSRCSKDQKKHGRYYERLARKAANSVLLPQNPHPAFDKDTPVDERVQPQHNKNLPEIQSKLF